MELKIEASLDNIKKIEAHYKEPQFGLWAIVRYCGQQGKPYALAEYYMYGKELVSGEDLICFTCAPRSYNFSIIEKGFKSREAAKKRLVEIRTEKQKKQERILSQPLDT